MPLRHTDWLCSSSSADRSEALAVTDATGADAATVRAAVGRAAAAVAGAVAALSASDARTETLAEFVPEHRVRGIPRGARMRAIGRVWRLGVLLLDADGGVHATGHVVRSERPARRSITAEAVAAQRALRAAA